MTSCFNEQSLHWVSFVSQNASLRLVSSSRCSIDAELCFTLCWEKIDLYLSQRPQGNVTWIQKTPLDEDQLADINSGMSGMSPLIFQAKQFISGHSETSFNDYLTPSTE